MKSFDEMEYHPEAEKLVKILCSKTQNQNPLFFRVLVGYYMALVASMMRTTIVTHDRGEIPVNLYALNLSTSGSGKGMSMNIMENQVINQFRELFLTQTFPALAEINLAKIANKRSIIKGTDNDEELRRVQKEFKELGSLVFSFDSGTSPAVKQMRHMLLMANSGAVNLQIDEIGSNLIGNIEVLNTFLELFDVGAIKQKLTKNTAENQRGEDIIGRTPTNMLLFGTPAKLLNGGKTEEELYSMLETGYARRCFFGYSKASNKFPDGHVPTPQEVYDLLTNPSDNQFLNDYSDQLASLADMVNVGRKLTMSKDTALLLIEYKLKCEKDAEKYPEHEEIKKAEMSHRYFKAIKLAGAYAFCDNSLEITEDHLYNAIKLAEESGAAFTQLLTRERPYIKLAKYIAGAGKEVTQADLVEDLPFYKGAVAQKNEMLSLAIAYGYKNNIVIKKSYNDGIEFLRGETIKQTDINQIILSYSENITEDYEAQRVPFHKLHQLTQEPDLHWVNHHLNNGYRNEENVIPGFNLLVLDVDHGADLSTVQMLMQKYTYLIYTTKRHTEEENRFRIILPINYELKLDHKEYKEFIANIFESLPFEVDEQTNQRARKWLTNSGEYFYNDGELFDVLPFIPKTSKNDERKERRALDIQQNMNALESWVTNNIGDGNRNVMLHRYAMLLLDGGFELSDIRKKVLELNEKIADKLPEDEITNTIMLTVTKAYAAKH